MPHMITDKDHLRVLECINAVWTKALTKSDYVHEEWQQLDRAVAVLVEVKGRDPRDDWDGDCG